MSSNDRFAYLLDRYVSGQASTAETDELFTLLHSGQFDTRLAEHISDDLAGDHSLAGAELPPHISQEIVRNILSAEKNTAAILPMPRRRFPWQKVAAALLLLTGLAIGYLLLKPSPASNDFTAQIPGKTKTVRNASDTLQLLTLEDGSRITLHPGTSFYYPEHFADTLREVYMDGSAFFEIEPNPQKPFLVYARHIVTRVLGTSFLVSTNPQSGNEEVSVSTGRVQVTENIRNLDEKSVTASPVIITPNQKVVYEPGKRAFLATLVDKPAMVTQPPHVEGVRWEPHIRFQFEQDKLATVFAELQRAYGIEIITDNPALDKCLFTGDVSGNDLFTQLKIICLATHSSYELNGTRVLIKGQGCDQP